MRIVHEVILMLNGKEYKVQSLNTSVMKDLKPGDAIRYATNAQSKLTMAVKIFDPESEDFTFVNKGEGLRYYTENAL